MYRRSNTCAGAHESANMKSRILLYVNEGQDLSLMAEFGQGWSKHLDGFLASKTESLLKSLKEGSHLKF